MKYKSDNSINIKESAQCLGTRSEPGVFRGGPRGRLSIVLRERVPDPNPFLVYVFLKTL